MADNQFELSIITPLKTIYQDSIISLIVPSELGFLGILKNHAPLVANLAPGKITIKDKSNSLLIFNSNSKGILEVVNNIATVALDSTPNIQ
ncbi:MAG: hypothetical protein AB1755_04305 [Candidatus Omnitrophota bacterium]